MGTVNENNKFDTYISFNEYQRNYPYNGTTPSDYLKWLMEYAPPRVGHNIKIYTPDDVNIVGRIFKG